MKFFEIFFKKLQIFKNILVLIKTYLISKIYYLK